MMTGGLKRLASRGAAALMLGFMSVSSSWAHWRFPSEMPVARLTKNVQEYITAHPKDPHGYYTLGRIHSSAFAHDTESIGAYTGDPLPHVPTYTQNLFQPRNKPLSQQAETHLAEALKNYTKAASLDSMDAKVWLSLGFQCEEAIRFPKGVVKAGGVFAPAKPLDAEGLRQKALEYYRKAYALSAKPDKTGSGGVVIPVSWEAADGIIRLQKEHQLSATEQSELDDLQKQIAILKTLPRAITPILISFDRHATLSDLVSPERHVPFDLAGDGLKHSWPWVKPTTGILVWDPKHTGKITSGLQLFGNVTWWLFWKDGYDPLDALDNNHNGWLEGAELQGISVWFDRNSNAISDPGEVVSLSSLGIKRIATHSAGLSDGVPANPNGIQLKDGSSLATYDWTPTSVNK